MKYEYLAFSKAAEWSYLDYIVVDCSGRQRSRHIAGEEAGKLVS